MTTVYVREQGSTVRKRGERLVVTKDGEELMDMPLMHVKQLAVVGNIQLTTPAVAALLQNEVDVIFFSSRFKFRGRLMTTGSKFAQLRHAQLQAMGDEAAALRLARDIVVGKLSNQRTLLQRRLQKVVEQPAHQKLKEAVAGIGRMADATAQARSLDSLRGYEGKAGAYYFAGLRALLDPGWKFQRRAYYPPPDPINAALSFGYSLLLKDTTSAVQLVGLDPFLGFFHAIDYGRPSMALDIMEEFRPIIVDTLVLALVREQRLTPADFVRTGRQKRPVELVPKAVEMFLRVYEERLAAKIRHPVAHQRTSYRRCLELQARQVANIVLDKAKVYVPVTIK